MKKVALVCGLISVGALMSVGVAFAIHGRDINASENAEKPLKTVAPLPSPVPSVRIVKPENQNNAIWLVILCAGSNQDACSLGAARIGALYEEGNAVSLCAKWDDGEECVETEVLR